MSLTNAHTKFRLAAASINTIVMDWQGNMRSILGAIEDAKARGVALLCLPELCVTGYGCEDMFHSPHLLEKAKACVLDILPHTKGIAVSVGIPFEYKSSVYNVACLLVDGELMGIVPKTQLANEGIYYEERWFTAWQSNKSFKVRFADIETDFGFMYFELNSLPDSLRVGYEICEDAWRPNRPAERLSNQGIHIMLHPSASHFSLGKMEERERYILDSSRRYACVYIFSNLLGNESGKVIFDGANIIASCGEILNKTQAFSFEDRTLCIEEIDVQSIQAYKNRQYHTPNKDSKNSNDNKDNDEILCKTFDFAVQEGIELPQRQSVYQRGEQRNEQDDFTHALSLALYDYLRKSYAQGFVISLSGGADSACVFVLGYFMIYIGVQDLGISGFLKKLSHIEGIQSCNSTQEICHKLITTAYQKTENNASITEDAARFLSEELGSEHLSLDIEHIYKSYVELISEATGEKLSWQSHDLQLQNIQARTRAPSIWLIANMKNKLLLTTSNRSELAVGYNTMDGDTCGGLAPVAGIDKTFLRKYLVYIEKQGFEKQKRVKNLSYINQQVPTAELRPIEQKQQKQEDEKDLMPYEVLQKIEHMALVEKKSPIECYEVLKLEHRENAKLWIMRFFQLWSINQWKRERSAPAFHIDTYNLDPRSWCRFPILSSGFKDEIEALKLID